MVALSEQDLDLIQICVGFAALSGTAFIALTFSVIGYNVCHAMVWRRDPKRFQHSPWDLTEWGCFIVFVIAETIETFVYAYVVCAFEREGDYSPRAFLLALATGPGIMLVGTVACVVAFGVGVAMWKLGKVLCRKAEGWGSASEDEEDDGEQALLADRAPMGYEACC